MLSSLKRTKFTLNILGGQSEDRLKFLQRATTWIRNQRIHETATFQ